MYGTQTDKMMAHSIGDRGLGTTGDPYDREMLLRIVKGRDVSVTTYTFDMVPANEGKETDTEFWGGGGMHQVARNKEA